MPPDDPRVWEEIDKLRAWRHDVVIPELASVRGRLHVAEGRLDRIEPAVERMAHADEIADAVKRVIWKAAVAIGSLIVGTAAVVGVILSVFH